MVIYISLGFCSVKKQMQNNNINQPTLPFDWLKINNINTINELLSNNFDDFLNNLEFVKDNKKFFVEKQIDKISRIYKNSKYDIYFCHDFYDSDFSEQIDGVQNKYNRRINRLYEILRSNEKIIFIRDDIFYNQITIDYQIINKFDNILKSINSEINYELIWIINPKKKKFTVDKYEIQSNIKIIIDRNKPTSWWHDEIDWNNILN